MGKGGEGGGREEEKFKEKDWSHHPRIWLEDYLLM